MHGLFMGLSYALYKNVATQLYSAKWEANHHFVHFRRHRRVRTRPHRRFQRRNLNSTIANNTIARTIANTIVNTIATRDGNLAADMCEGAAPAATGRPGSGLNVLSLVG